MPEPVRSSQEGLAITTITHARARRKPPREKPDGSRRKLKRRQRADTLLTCKQEVAFISGYISGQLKTSAQAAFQAHLEACPDCAAFLTTYKKTIEITRSFLSTNAAKNLPRKPTFLR
jgi:anti-sigma factor RsiW